MNKTYLFIDGSNLYGAQFDLFGPKKYLDFSSFISKVEKNLKIKFDKILFYASFSPKPKKTTNKQKQYLINEGLFYSSVRKNKKVVFFKGYRSPTSGKEKEVDVKLAADMVHLAHLGKFNQLFLLTGDADFLQALFLIGTLKVKIQLIFMENRIMYQGFYKFSSHIIKFSDKKIIPKKKFGLNIFQLKEQDVIQKII